MNHYRMDREKFENAVVFILTILVVSLIAWLSLGCAEKPWPGKPSAEDKTADVDVKYILQLNDQLVQDNTEMEEQLTRFKLAERIQYDYAKRGENKSSRLIRETIKQAFDICEIYDAELPDSLSSETFAYYLITFASVESNFTPIGIGKAGDSGICQTLKKDFPRLAKKARNRGLDFKDDLKSVRASLICCAEEYLEKLGDCNGDIRQAVWRYNGNRSYLKRWLDRYEFIRKGE